MRGLKARANVLGQPCKILCTLRTTFENGQQVDEVTIEVIIDPNGQEITPNMLTFDQHKELLSTIKQQIKPL